MDLLLKNKENKGELVFDTIDNNCKDFGDKVFFGSENDFKNGKVVEDRKKAGSRGLAAEMVTAKNFAKKIKDQIENDGNLTEVCQNLNRVKRMIDIVNEVDQLTNQDIKRDELKQELRQLYDDLGGSKWMFDYLFACNHVLKDDPGAHSFNRGKSFKTHEKGWDWAKAMISVALGGKKFGLEYAGSKIEKQAAETFVIFNLLYKSLRYLQKTDNTDDNKIELANNIIDDAISSASVIVESNLYKDVDWQDEAASLAAKGIAVAQKVMYTNAKMFKTNSELIKQGKNVEKLKGWDDKTLDKYGNPLNAYKKAADGVNDFSDKLAKVIKSGKEDDIVKFIGLGVIKGLVFNSVDIARKLPEDKYRLLKSVTVDEEKRIRKIVGTPILSLKFLTSLIEASGSHAKSAGAGKNKKDIAKALKERLSGENVCVDMRHEAIQSILNDIKIKSLNYFKNCTNKNFDTKLEEFMMQFPVDSRYRDDFGNARLEIYKALRSRIEKRVSELKKIKKVEKEEDDESTPISRGMTKIINYTALGLLGVKPIRKSLEKHCNALKEQGKFGRNLVISELDDLIKNDNGLIQTLSNMDVVSHDPEMVLRKNYNDEKLLSCYGIGQSDVSAIVPLRESMSLVPENENKLIN